MGGELRIQRGEWSGRRLDSPADAEIRPMGARLRCKVMDALWDAIAGAVVYDLCCGSGAQGIEALSLGATHVTFVDRDPRALKLARANVALCGEQAVARATFLRRDVDRALEDVALADHPGTLILFVSPPYPTSATICALALRVFVAITGVRGDSTILVLQHPPKLEQQAPEGAPPAERRVYKAGNSAASIFRAPPPLRPRAAAAEDPLPDAAETSE